MAKILKINDAGWLLAETSRTPAHVGVLATFSMPDDADEDYLEDLVTRWREQRTFQPPFNYRLKSLLGLPRWDQLADEDIDLDYHLRHSAVPSPGGERELGVLVSRLHSSRLDRTYPLWECHVIEGLEQDRWSLYLKAHHSQVDGVGGIRILRRFLSADPDARDMLPPWAIGTHGPDQSGTTASASRRAEEEATSSSLLGGLAGTLTGGVRSGAAGCANRRSMPGRASSANQPDCGLAVHCH